MAYTRIPAGTSGGGFGAQTIVDLPNSAQALVPALEMDTALTTTTPGSEVSSFLLSLLSAGAQLGAFKLEPAKATTDSGGNTTWNWILKFNGTAVASVGFNQFGQMFILATHATGIQLQVGATPGAQSASDTVAQVTSAFGVRMLNGSIQQRQFDNIVSASTLVVPNGGATGGNAGNVSGSTTINLIDSTFWRTGSVITLVFSAAITLKHNQAPVSTGLPMLLANHADAVVPAAGGRITFVLTGTNSGTAPATWLDISGVIPA